jgi:protein-S-isoprenylcysteine O-methyltransferase Ste14
MSISGSKGSGSSPKKPTMGSLLPNLLLLIFMLAAILFGSDGGLDWLQAWMFLLAFSGYLTLYGLWAVRKDPEQLMERSRYRENTKSWDKLILAVYTILLVGMLVLVGLDAGRFRWAPVSPVFQGVGWLGAVLTGIWIGWTVSVNTFLSRAVRIQTDRSQRVIDAGPYHFVRHPMYIGIIVLMVSIPLLLGSLFTLIPGAMIGVLYIIRTALEDRALKLELPGYDEYSQRIRYKLIPYVW